MTDNNLPDVQLDANSNGKVYFASDVVATIAGLAVTEVEGVANTVGVNNGFADIFSRRTPSNSKNLTRGIKVEILENTVGVDVTIIVEYGSPVPEVASAIQENVKKAIETMTGMTVRGVDVHIQGVSFERENRAAAELEMQQRKLLEKKTADDRAMNAAADSAAVEAPRPRVADEPEAPAAETQAAAPDDGGTEETGDDFQWVLEDVPPEAEGEAEEAAPMPDNGDADVPAGEAEGEGEKEC